MALEKNHSYITQHDFYHAGIINAKPPHLLPKGSEVKVVEIDELSGFIIYQFLVLAPPRLAGQRFSLNRNANETQTLFK